MAVWVVVGGTAGAGKSTLVNTIGETAPGARLVRPVDSFFRLANRLGIDRSRAFDLARSHEEEILEDTLARLRGAPLIVSDVHYAIQPARDSALAVSGVWKGEPLQPYSAALNSNLFRRARGIERHTVFLVLLWTDPHLVLERLRRRDGERARHATLNDVIEEAHAEHRYWKGMSSCADISRSFDTGKLGCRLLAQQILKAIKHVSVNGVSPDIDGTEEGPFPPGSDKEEPA